ncbi:uncharacterized protein [Periplaneta americana]|uniref:uncharacterized protein n=1 Tax=Periplaneta americana TaxID=6978 RepID=UPI0037E82694
MAWYLVCLISIVAVSQVGPTELPNAGTMIEMQFEVSRPCEDFPDGDIKLSNLSMEQLGRNQMAMSGLLDMKVTLDERFQLMVTLIRCNSKSDRGNCEEFPPSPITDMCEKLPQEDQIWTDFVHKLQNFTPKCPVPPGSYAFHQHKLDMDSVANMPLMVGYWIMKSEGFVGEDKVMCELSEMSFTRKKIKKG